MRIERLDERVVLSTFSVLNLDDSGTGSLRAAITAANTNPGSDIVAFAPDLRGTIGLTSGELSITDSVWIDGPGADRLAVSGNDASRVFQISSGVAASIDDLTVTHGRAVGQGGGILNAGTLTLSHAILSDNQVIGTPGTSVVVPGQEPTRNAWGGGIFNSGAITVYYSSFVHNKSIGADGTSDTSGTAALGGAIMSSGTAIAPATATISHSTFFDNEAVAGAAGNGSSLGGFGGAIHNHAGTFTVSHSVFHNNQAVGGIDSVPGGFGAGSGGAISNIARVGDARLSVSYCTFTNNRAVGGAAGAGTLAQDGRGGAIANFIFPGLAAPVTVTATASIDHSTILGNQAIGGAGPTGGNGQGGGIANLYGGVLSVSDSLIALNRAIGGSGDGGSGGNGQGGGIFNGGPSPVGTPSLTLERSLVTLNRAEGGAAAGGGSPGQGWGGGVYLALGGIATADLTTILANDASTSDDDVFGIFV